MAVINFLAILHFHGKAVVHGIKSYELGNKRTEIWLQTTMTNFKFAVQTLAEFLWLPSYVTNEKSYVWDGGSKYMWKEVERKEKPIQAGRYPWTWVTERDRLGKTDLTQKSYTKCRGGKEGLRWKKKGWGGCKSWLKERDARGRREWRKYCCVSSQLY